MRSGRYVRRLMLLVGLPLVFVVALALTPAEPAATAGGGDRGDVALWTAIVDRMWAGEPYYEASAAELRARHYPTRSIFNWRLPLVYQVLGILGLGPARVLLVAVALVLVVRAGRLLGWGVVGLLAMVNATLMMGAPYGPYLTELWAGAFLGLSALAYAQRRDGAGVGWALLALFTRELAAPYCVVATGIALWRRRRQEVAAWAIGAAAYGVYYGWHVWQASRHIRLDDVAHAASWLRWGGIPFLLETWRYDGLFLIAPRPIFALSVVGVAAAAWAPRMPLHVRAGVVAYALFFLAIGQPFNGYWGFLTAPLIALWLGYAPAGLRVLWASR